jgi:CheY-like chemotaxis protein
MEDIERGIGQVRKDMEAHRRLAAEAQEKLKDLIDQAISEIVKLKAIRSRLEWLAQNAEQPPGRETEGDVTESEPPAKLLDWELDKLHVIQRMLGAAAPKSYGGEGSRQVPPSSTPRKMRVLVVDDDPITVNIVTHFLREENVETLSSLSGIEGLRLALVENPDLIVLDILMPDLSGYQFLSAFRRAKKSDATPVIILSTLSAEADVLKGLEFGASDYVTKPFSPRVLMAKIKKALSP